MVVGHQHLHAQGSGARHAVDAGNAVVNRDQQLRAGGLHAFGNRRGQAIAVNDPVRHQIADAGGTQQPQPAQRHRAGCRAIAVVVGDHAYFFPGRHRIGQQAGRLLRTMQRRRRQQLAQGLVKLVKRMNATRCI